jgi:hypothetical protein
MCQLIRITHSNGDGKSLRVTFGAGKQQHTIAATAAQVESFAAFRRLVLKEMGILLRHEAEYPGRRGQVGKMDWLDEVETALAKGREVE